ncbi:MAG TPA: hypothetical protein VN843_01525 [Anaerolineales bacterium]|nr:hypothetical protein [Anaerolineales bacterium]
MDELIEDFITSVFTPEFVILIRKAFSLFEAFEHQNAYSGMNDAIMNESISDVHERSSHFSVELCHQLDYILNQHLITLTDIATVSDRVQILDALYRLQHLEDYTGITLILTTDDDEIDKFSRILEELTGFDQGYLLTILQSVDARTLELLERYIHSKESHVPEEPVNPDIIERIKLFSELFGQESIGCILLEAGMILGLPIKLYLPFVQENLVVQNNHEKTSMNVLSVIYISNTEEHLVIETYRAIAEGLFNSLDEVGKVEGFLVRLLSQVSELRKIKHEKIRLSQESA